MLKRLRLLGLFVSVSALAGEPTTKAVQALALKLMLETQVVFVALSGPVSEFKPDDNPNTLQVVTLTNKNDGPSRVSDDGEVIFLYMPSDRQQQNLITKAFEIRARRRLGGVQQSLEGP